MKSALGAKLKSLFSKPFDPEMIEELEKLFYEADLGASFSIELVEKLEAFARKSPNPETFLPFIKEKLLEYLPENNLPTMTKSPHIILVVGVNGAGKTTSLIKLANYFLKEKKTVLIAAGDTFRAAAVEQLETWSKKLNIPLIKSQPNSDPAAVSFDAITSAKAKGIDIVLIDTAGRLQTKTSLMQELAKIRRICQQQVPSAPEETLLVVDATTGQNGLDQAKIFHEFTPITGIILTKLDGSAKGGIAIAIQRELKIPIQWVGIGEKEDDLYPFDREGYVNGLLSISD